MTQSITQFDGDESKFYVNDTEVESESVNQQESSTQVVENTDSEMTAEELLDLFIDGSIDAIDATDMTSTFNRDFLR